MDFGPSCFRDKTLDLWLPCSANSFDMLEDTVRSGSLHLVTFRRDV